MKYIDADQLKKEIERQKHYLKTSIQSQGDYGQSCQIVAYENILHLLDTLPEQPVEGLEEEIERFYRTDEYRIADTLGRGFETLARHFAEWQYQKDRVEFAKLKAREWINGYDEGYAKGLDARKEDK